MLVKRLKNSTFWVEIWYIKYIVGKKFSLTSDAKVIKKFCIFKRIPLKITIIEMTLKFKI